MKLLPDYLYNPSGLDTWHTLKEDMKTNKDTILNRNFIGDSITSGSSCGILDITNYLNKSFVGIIKNHDNSKYQNCGNGFIHPFWHEASIFQYLTFSEGWIKSGTGGQTYIGGVWESYLTWTPNATVSFEFVGTGIRLYYVQGLINIVGGSKAAGTFTTTIDGAEAVEHSTAGTANNYKYIDITGLENGRHSITITFTGTSDQALNLTGIMELTPATYGIRNNNLGRPGAAAGWSFTSTTKSNFIANCHLADLAVMMLGTNDYAAMDLVTNDFEDSYAGMVEKLISAGSEVLIVVEPEPTAVYTPPWTDYVEAMYNVADTYDLSLLDLTKRSEGRNLLSDGIHFNAKGHRDAAQALLKVI